jgi:V/A-type H+-transporting ATPase subunit K
MFFESLSNMEPALQKEVVSSLGKAGAAFAISFAAIGSALGTGAAGIAAVNAWKKCYAQNKMAPFMLVAFVGAPLTQTIYGMIVMGKILEAAASSAMYHNLLLGGIAAGIAIAMSAWMQGRAGAGASDALAETGKGFVNYLMVLGVIETVALFVMVFITKAVT